MSVRRTVAAALAAGLLLAGCSDDPEPRFAPAESPTPSETSSSAAPAAQSPEEFIRDWVTLQREMQNTGQVDDYLAASRGCSSCKSTADIVESYYAAGGFVRTEGRRVLEINPIEPGETYDVKVRSAPTKFKESEAGPLKSLPGGVTTYRVTLRQIRGEWVLANELEVAS